MDQKQHIHQGGLRHALDQLDKKEVRELSEIKEQDRLSRFRAWSKIKKKFWALKQEVTKNLYQQKRLATTTPNTFLLSQQCHTN